MHIHLGPPPATFPSRLILPDLIIIIKFGEEYKLRSFLSGNFLQLPVMSFALGPNNLFSTLFPNTLSVSQYFTSLFLRSASIRNAILVEI
jgi:hypothetical protein